MKNGCKRSNMGKYDNIKTFDQLIDIEHGEIGTENRIKYEENSQIFIISEMLKEAKLHKSIWEQTAS
jgi:hypothetical protein